VTSIDSRHVPASIFAEHEMFLRSYLKTQLNHIASARCTWNIKRLLLVHVSSRNLHRAVNNMLIHGGTTCLTGFGPMSGYRAQRMANLSTTLPIPMLETIDELIREGKVPSRSFVIREAVRNYLRTFE
jgi:PII-like signaling protein